MFTRKRGLLFFVPNQFIIFNLNARPAQQLAHRAPLHGNYQPRMLDLTRDVRQLQCTSSLMDGTIRQGITPSCRTPTTRAGSHEVTRA